MKDFNVMDMYTRIRMVSYYTGVKERFESAGRMLGDVQKEGFISEDQSEKIKDIRLQIIKLGNEIQLEGFAIRRDLIEAIDQDQVRIRSLEQACKRYGVNV